jgi:hypothetical protein
MKAPNITIPKALIVSILEEFNTCRDGVERDGLTALLQEVLIKATDVDPEICLYCNGTGERIGMYGHLRNCPACRGQQKKYDEIEAKWREEEEIKSRFYTHGCLGDPSWFDSVDCELCLERQLAPTIHEMDRVNHGQMITAQMLLSTKDTIRRIEWKCQPFRKPTFGVEVSNDNPSAVSVVFMGWKG